MKKNPKPMDAFSESIGRTKYPPLDGKYTHNQIADHYAYEVVNTALRLMGVDHIKADELAGNHGGPARARYRACLKILGKPLRGFRGDSE